MLVFPMLVAVGGTTALTLLWASVAHVHGLENLAWLVIFFRNRLDRCHSMPSFLECLGWVREKLSLTTCLNDFVRDS